MKFSEFGEYKFSEFERKPRMDYDNVFRPKHYNNGDVECIDAIESATQDLKGIEAVCTGNVIKYMWRWKMKGMREDLEKARWYLDRLINKISK